jgi:hypothetical protein
MSNDLLLQALESDINLTHQRFVVAMEGRLPGMALEQKERYFVILSALVGKLEVPGKGLHEILQEMMTESATIVLQEINAAR